MLSVSSPASLRMKKPGLFCDGFRNGRWLWGWSLLFLWFSAMGMGCGQPEVSQQQIQHSLTSDGGPVPPDTWPNPDEDPGDVADASTPMPDYIPPMPDYNVPMPDYIPPTPDYSTPMPDYMPPTPDYNVPMPDYMPPMPDYTPTPDYVPPTPDYTPTPDYVLPTPDYTPTPDTAEPWYDIDTSKPDATVPPPDRAVGPEAEPVPEPRPEANPEVPPEKKKLCCVCQYWTNGRCGGLDQATCGKTRDCTWFQNKCMPRHEKDCINWMADAAQKDCDEKKTIVAGQDPTGGLRDCTSFRYNYEGHGLGCNNLAQRIKVCVNRLPQCTRFDIDDTGCSTFNDLAAASTQMQTVIASLGGDQCVNVSANQCTASNVCQSRYVYTINSKTCTGQPDPCNNGAKCHKHNEVAQCRQNNQNTVQICCCDTINDTKNCQWEAGHRSCQYAPCNDGGACSPQGRLKLCNTGQGITSQVCCCDGNGRNCAWKARVRSCN